LLDRTNKGNTRGVSHDHIGSAPWQ